MSRLIAHVDMDCFFAAVEVLDNPALKGRPVIVGADPKGGKGRGVVSAASYEARKYGIHSAMPISKAYNLCPKGSFLPGRMSRYSEMSNIIMDILLTFTPNIEQISVDEAFLDLSGCQRLLGTPQEMGRTIKTHIKEKTRLTASVGIAPNKLIAKIASDLQKPDGLIIVPPGKEKSFLSPMPVNKLWGVGPKTAERMNKMGINTIGELAEYNPKKLVAVFGKAGIYLNQRANGIDEDPVSAGQAIKSIGRENTFDEDKKEPEILFKTLLNLSDQVAGNVRTEGLKGRTITLKLRYDDFETHTYSKTVSRPTDLTNEIYAIVRLLLEKHWQKFRRIRLIGVSVSNLNDGEQQLGLFEDQAKTLRNEKLEKAVDAIREKYGKKAVRRAGEI